MEFSKTNSQNGFFFSKNLGCTHCVALPALLPELLCLFLSFSGKKQKGSTTPTPLPTWMRSPAREPRSRCCPFLTKPTGRRAKTHTALRLQIKGIPRDGQQARRGQPRCRRTTQPHAGCGDRRLQAWELEGRRPERPLG